MNPYKSCNCRSCRRTSSARRGFHKRKAHRAFRRQEKAAVRAGDDSSFAVSTGYKA